MEPAVLSAEVIDNGTDSISKAASDEEPDAGPVTVLFYGP